MIPPKHEEHDRGWRVILDGEAIAELNYLHDDQPWHVFAPSLLTSDEGKISYGLRDTAFRAPGERLVFECRGAPVRVPDSQFFVSFREDGTVAIRDVRLPSKRA